MYRAVFVDDEPYAIEGLKRMLPLEAYSIRLEATFSDAVDALDYIIKQKPDIVFADIRMPKMSGIEMLQRARAAASDVELVLISGYDEFNYVCKAIELGVLDYIVKPVSEPDITHMLKRVEQKLSTRRALFLDKALDSLFQPESAGLVLKQLGLRVEGKYFVAMLENVDPNFNLECLGMEESFFITCSCNRRLLIAAEEDVTSIDQAFSIIQGISSAAGIGGFGEICEFCTLYRHAMTAVAQRLVDPAATYYVYQGDVNAEFQRGYLRLRQELLAQNSDASIQALEDIAILFNKGGLTAEDASQLWNGTVEAFDISAFCEPLTLYDHFQNLDVFFSELKRLILSAVSKSGNDSVSDHVEEIIEDIKMHFSQPLSLADLSARHHLNASYLSTLFRRATGLTISSYITNLRMTRAVEMIEAGNTLLKVAEAVGYQDYFYFSKTFRKHFGCPPSEYHKKTYGLENGQ